MTKTMATDGLLPVGSLAPDIILPALGDEPHRPRLARDESRLGLTVFFKRSCPTCRLVLPFLQRLHERIESHGGAVIGVSQDDAAETSDFAQENGLSLPILIDGPRLDVSRRYDLLAVPTLYLTDGAGKIRRARHGFHKEDLQLMGDELAASVGAPAAPLYGENESVPDFKPG